MKKDLSNNDLTVIFLTCNELPEEWMSYHKKVLLEAIGDAKLITMSMKPMDMPGRNILQDKPKSLSNIYWQILRACKSTDTKYIAIAEDDSLYPKEHFQYRPKKESFAYNRTHWSLFTWGKPIYNWRDRQGNYTMIAKRESVIKALEERYAKYPNGTPDIHTGEIGRYMVEHWLRVTEHKIELFYTDIAIINICHELGMDDRAKRHQKILGHIQALDIPYWGKSCDLIKEFK